MFDEVDPPSPSGALVSLAPLDPEWQPILHISNQVVLYNPTSHALSIRTTPNASLARRASRHCPYCHRTIPTEMHAAQDVDVDDVEHGTVEDDEFTWRPRSRASNYFQLLETANETMSRPATPQRTIPAHEDSSRSTDSSNGGRAFRADNMAEGYFKAFFREEGRLGMGANGTVYLCQVTIRVLQLWGRLITTLLSACLGWELIRYVLTLTSCGSAMLPSRTNVSILRSFCGEEDRRRPVSQLPSQHPT